MPVVQHLRPGQLEQEQDKLDDPREPPIPVVAWLLLDSAEHAGLLHGWAVNPNGSNDGWRGLVQLNREFAPGFWAEGLHWVPAERIRRVPAVSTTKSRSRT